VLALDDGALAIVLIAATRLPRGEDRAALLRTFAAAAEKRPRAARRSPAAEKQRRYRARLKCGEATFPVPIGPDVVAFLVRAGWLPADRDVHTGLEIAEAAGACLRDTARCN